MSVRTFSLIIGIVFLAAGALGFVPAFLMPPPDNAPHVGVAGFHGYLFGLFPVNFLLNLGHLAIGAWGISASRSVGGARAYSKTLAVLGGALAILGIIPATSTMFGLVPLHGNDVWLHGGAALLAAYFGWVHRSSAAPATPLAHPLG